MGYKKKLIEVALPIEAINLASAHEKMPGIGAHPRGVHLWWARRPLAAARAVIFAQLVDDPSEHPNIYPTPEQQDQERRRLFAIIEELVKWENASNESVLAPARDAILRSWQLTCAENSNHPNAPELFNPKQLPGFNDPFSGGGALPLEAQRLGLSALATDLNPVAVLINKAILEIVPRFGGRPPVNPPSREDTHLFDRRWDKASGLAADVIFYGNSVLQEARRRLGDIYPAVKITTDVVADRPELLPYEGCELSVVAYLWVRTVKSPNPAFADADVPLISNFILSTKPGKEVWVELKVDPDIKEFSFLVRSGKPTDPLAAKSGTKMGKTGFKCIYSPTPIPFEYIRAEAKHKRLGQRLMAIVLDGSRERVYVRASVEEEKLASLVPPANAPDATIPPKALGFRIQEYGMERWTDLFTARQLKVLTMLSDLVSEARDRIATDAVGAGLVDNPKEGLRTGSDCAQAYAEAVSMVLAFVVDRCLDFSNTLTRWVSGNEKVMNVFAKQSISMTWDFPECALLNDVVGGFPTCLEYIAKCLSTLDTGVIGRAVQQDAASSVAAQGRIVSTDPPYYDNIGYADLSDFFYVWLRRPMRAILPELFSTMKVPKNEEIIANPYRFKSKSEAEDWFLTAMSGAFGQLASTVHPAFPVTIYYAFKQAEATKSGGIASTGWETFLEAVTRSGFALTGTWPIRTEQAVRSRGLNSNALASSVVLVCRQRPADAPTIGRREFVQQLRRELPAALVHLQQSNIAPVDLAQSAIGPGMSVFTRYSKVVNAQGANVSVKEALALINEIMDECLAEQDGDFDSDTRWTLAWFEQSGFNEGDYGVAETLSKAKNTSIRGLEDAGVLAAKSGKVRLLKPEELLKDWDPGTNTRSSVWEMVHHLVRVLEGSGESAAADLVRKLGTKAEIARELCYRLYTICERKKRANEARSYNNLVQSWPEITRLAREAQAEPQQGDLFENVGEKVG